MLGHASQTSGVMQHVHDKPWVLPDPDIFAVDSSQVELLLVVRHREAHLAHAVAGPGGGREVWIVKMSGSGRLQLVMLHLNHAEICVASVPKDAHSRPSLEGVSDAG